MEFAGIEDLVRFDATKSRDGIPVDFRRGRVVWVRQAGGHNRAAAFVTARILEEMSAEFRACEALEDEAAKREERARLREETDKRLLADHLVTRWEGFVDRDGTPIDCNPETARQLIDAAPEVFARLRRVSEGGEGYRLAEDTKSAAPGDRVADDKRPDARGDGDRAGQGDAGP